MLKAQVDQDIWLVQQHQHAQVSGYLAAHWGNAEGFTRPGHYAGATDPAAWQDQVVLGTAEHDNGWWEWEAMPRINGLDNLPVGLGESVEPVQANEFDAWRAGGFERWHVGIDRLADPYPYAALLVNYHAYWLYAVAFEDFRGELGETFAHPVFGDPATAANLAKDQTQTRAFLNALQHKQAEFTQRLSTDPNMADATQPHHLYPHIKLVQLLDSLSLFMARNDQGEHILRNVPRAGWDDRVDMVWKHVGPRTYTLDPYPFEADFLPVRMPVKVAPDAGLHDTPPLTSLHRLEPDVLTFEIHRG